MRPLNLELKGFSAFRDETEIDFTNIDLLALVGPTGSGKSTIIDGITFALYGAVARYDDNRMVAPVINQTSTEARVRLTFEVGGREYAAVRVVRRSARGATTREARLERGEDVLAADARSMSDAVEQLIGLDADQFNRTVVLPQGKFADFLHAEPRERQATLRQLLGLEVYERIGKAARQRATEKEAQVTLLGQELDSDADLSAERRIEIEHRLNRLKDTRLDLRLRRAGLEEMIRQRAAIERDQEADRAHQALLGSVVRPDGIDELAGEVVVAKDTLDVAERHLADATLRRTAASEAAEAGPNTTTYQLLVGKHDQLADELERVRQLEIRLQQVSTELSAVAGSAAALRFEQARLDAVETAAHASVAEAEVRATEHPSVTTIERWIELRQRHLRAIAARDHALAGVEEIQQALPELATSAEREAVRVQALENRLLEAERQVGATAYRDLLRVGEPCPLCESIVGHVPEHDDQHGVDAIRAELGEGRDRERAARTQRDRAAADLASASRALDVAERDRAEAEELVADLPEAGELSAQLELAQSLTADVVQARRQAKEVADAASSFRNDLHHREVLDRESVLSRELADLSARIGTRGETAARIEEALKDAPDRDECQRLVNEAERLAADRREAEINETAARDALEASRSAFQLVQNAVRASAAELSATRDRVAVLQPPRLDLDDVPLGWSALIDWSAAQAGNLDAAIERRQLEIDETTLRERAEIDALSTQVREACGDEAIEGTLDDLDAVLETEVLAASGELQAFDIAKARVSETKQRIEALKGEQAVAARLGHLLRSDGFERWLMQSALEGLAERATDRLLELSGSQYSLVLDDRSFAVRDHANADEIRSARTLSGGETFLTSLALALALAETTAELSAESSPAMESMFLDEGFGTLDADTLDVVATAIEELGATGRMVCIVTHIRDLADRMPVRFEVTKLAGSSRVERVEA